MGRDEELAKPYPMWIERLLLLLAAVVFYFSYSEVVGVTDIAVLGLILGYILYPLALLAAVELLGRGLQRWFSS